MLRDTCSLATCLHVSMSFLDIRLAAARRSLRSSLALACASQDGFAASRRPRRSRRGVSGARRSHERRHGAATTRRQQRPSDGGSNGDGRLHRRRQQRRRRRRRCSRRGVSGARGEASAALVACTRGDTVRRRGAAAQKSAPSRKCSPSVGPSVYYSMCVRGALAATGWFKRHALRGFVIVRRFPRHETQKSRRPIMRRFVG